MVGGGGLFALRLVLRTKCMSNVTLTYRALTNRPILIHAHCTNLVCVYFFFSFMVLTLHAKPVLPDFNQYPHFRIQ